MKNYNRCPDCGLEIPFDAEVCPYCAGGFEAKIRKFHKSKDKRKRKK